MDVVPGYALLFATALLGWRFARLLKIPSPTIVGAMLAVGAATALGAEFPRADSMKFILQILVGMTIGIRVDRNTLVQMKSGLLPSVAVVVWVLLTSFGVGAVLNHMTLLDRATSLVSATPGGLTEMSLTAITYGAHAPSVALLHLTRLLTVQAVVSLVATFYSRKSNGVIPELGTGTFSSGLLLKYTAIALVGGAVFEAIGVPAGPLIGAILAVGAFKVWTGCTGVLPPSVIIAGQVGVGAVVGLRCTADTLLGMTRLLWPTIALLLLTVGGGLLLGACLWRVTSWDLATCILATAPGGIVQMTALAGSLGCDMVIVTTVHFVRLLTICGIVIPIIGRLTLQY